MKFLENISQPIISSMDDTNNFKEGNREDYRSWSIVDILKLSTDLKKLGGIIETESANKIITTKIKLESQGENIIIFFSVNSGANIFDSLKHGEEEINISNIDENTEVIVIPKGPSVTISKGEKSDDIKIVLDKDFADLDFESLGIKPLFKKDSIPDGLGKKNKDNQKLINEISKEGELHFVGRPNIPVKVVEGYAGINKLVPPIKSGMIRLYKGTNVEWAIKMMRDGIFSTPTQPNLSEELNGEVSIAIDGYGDNFGDKSYSVLLVVDCFSDEYEDQGGYEKFGVAKKEFKGNIERLGYLGKHMRQIPAERIVECIFVENETKK